MTASDTEMFAVSATSIFRKLRESLTGDRHRPLYHFVAPANWMNDPNGTFFWKGNYHLFYQYNPNGPFWGTIHWGHAVSSDLVHWEDFPIALTPSKEGPDKDGCWSGCVVDGGGIPTALYTGLEPQTVCLATSDDELRIWKKDDVPVINGPAPELELTGFPSITGHPSADFRDPCVWREGERWFLLIGAGMREKGGAALLYESEDLRHWRYLYPSLTGKVGKDCNMWECPVLLRSGERCALFVCPHPEAKYIYWLGGEWQNGLLKEYHRGKLDLGEYAYAAQCLNDLARDRHLLWNWIKEGRSSQAQRSAGWSGALSLPKDCSFDVHGRLVIKPPAELASLRTENRSIDGQRLTPSSQNPFAGFEGDCLEVEAEICVDEPTIFELSVRTSADEAERTTISYDSAKEALTVDGSQSSLDVDVDRPMVSGPLCPDQSGAVRFHVFLDRSILEVFVGDEFCITQRLYPTREDSLGLIFTIKKGSATVRHLSAWRLASIWPEKPVEGRVAKELAH